MKKRVFYRKRGVVGEKEITVIPTRYYVAAGITAAKLLLAIAAAVLLCAFVPYFPALTYAAGLALSVSIIASDDNPDYKLPWLFIVLTVPAVGIVLYFLFYSRKPKRKFYGRMKYLAGRGYFKDDCKTLETLRKQDAAAYNKIKMVCDLSKTHVFDRTAQKYFSSGEETFESLICDMKRARKFIFLEYFLIDEGQFWNEVLSVLKQKAAMGLEIKVIYDDIGCMKTLPGNYCDVLRSFGIDAVPFARLKGVANGEFNNRSHRKIAVIDGKIGYTGGVNIADEYINTYRKFGYWKDCAIRLEGEAVWELTRIFIVDFGLNADKIAEERNNRYPKPKGNFPHTGYIVPFGDGPRPFYPYRVAKSVISGMLSSAERYVYMTTPYFIPDNELCKDIEEAALRGVDVKIVLPHIPDKRLVYDIGKSFYKRLIAAGVGIYEYSPGFIHAKTYIADDDYALVGTINLDYRSLVHHFEDGVFAYKAEFIPDLKADILNVIAASARVTEQSCNAGIAERVYRSVARIVAPLL